MKTVINGILDNQRKPFGLLTDRQTDRPTDRQTDISKTIYPIFFVGWGGGGIKNGLVYHRYYLLFIFSPTGLFSHLMRMGGHRHRESKTPTGTLKKTHGSPNSSRTFIFYIYRNKWPIFTHIPPIYLIVTNIFNCKCIMKGSSVCKISGFATYSGGCFLNKISQLNASASSFFS